MTEIGVHQRMSFCVLLLIAVASLLTACGGSDHSDREAVALALTDAAPPDLVPEQAGGAVGFTHFVFEQVGDRVVTSLVEGPRGPQVRVPISFSELKKILESGLPVPPELEMNRDDLATLVEQLDTVRKSAERYRDVRVALADGFIQVGGVVPNMGAHFIHPGRVIDGVLNVKKPEIMLYDRDDSGGWRLVGTSFVLPRKAPLTPEGSAGDEHPDGFAGLLDNWHVHYELCTFPDGQFRTLNEAACETEGGVHAPSFGWMIHAWVLDDNPLGVFSMWNPNVPPLVGEEEVRAARAQAGPISSGTVNATIQNFEHKSIEIAEGESIAWVNADGVPHSVTSGSGGAASGVFDSKLFGPGQSFTKQFDQAGTFAFTCTIHPQMNGTVIVKQGDS